MNKINAIQALPLRYPVQQTTPEKSTVSFKDFLTDALHKVNAAQHESTKLTNQLITGEVEDLHQVTIASQKASITLDLTIQVRNRAVEAYQEIMRMQI